jgi:hypothetical protein
VRESRSLRLATHRREGPRVGTRPLTEKPTGCFPFLPWALPPGSESPRAKLMSPCASWSERRR